MISKIYSVIDNGKDAANKSTCHKLRDIEYKLIYLFEARDYIINGADEDKAEELLDNEKKLELERRAAKIERLK